MNTKKFIKLAVSVAIVFSFIGCTEKNLFNPAGDSDYIENIENSNPEENVALPEKNDQSVPRDSSENPEPEKPNVESELNTDETANKKQVLSPDKPAGNTIAVDKADAAIKQDQTQSDELSFSSQIKKPGDIYKLVIPDLVLSNFTINHNAMTHVNNTYDYPFSVWIRNVGTADVTESFDLSFQYYDSNNQWSGQNQPGFNCNRVNQTIAVGDSIQYTDTLRILNYQLSGPDVRVRAYVDSECGNEFPNAWGAIKESNEDNNYSNEVTILGGYHPYITSITPGTSIRGENDVIMIAGTGFGGSQGSHTVMLKNGSTKVAAQITNWYSGVIYFKVPSNTKIGVNKVTIANASTLNKCANANEINLNVRGKKVLSWSDLIATWDLFNEAFSLELNTHGGGSSYNNTSKLTLLQPTPVAVDKIEFNYAALKYRFLVKDMNSLPGGIVLTKQGCAANQLKMEISFESNGVELKAFNRALGPGGVWCDGCVADIHINNSKLTVTFTFSGNGGNLNFGLKTDFTASINASNGFANAMMDLFLGNWNKDVRDQVNNGVKAGLLDPANKNYILSEFSNLIKLLLGLNGKTVTQYEFESDGIHVTYTN
ncbi:MAG: IPT/TIG domain-containing protein [Chitinispirillia bacterium]|jgi:hypothetical protein